MSKEKKNREDRVGAGKLLIWQSRMIACSVCSLMYGFLMIYATDTLAIPAAMVSLLLLLSKVVDGVTDMIAGVIVDKTKTRWGKARPYEVFIVGLWLCTWLLFSCPPSFSTTVKCIWIFMMYTLANSVCYTFLNANSAVYTARAFSDKQIVKVTSYGSVIPMLAALAFNIVFPSMMGKIATSPAGWSRLVGMWAAPLAVIGLFRMFFVEEKYDVDVANEEKVKVKDILSVVKVNKYILLLAGVNFVFNFVTNMGVDVYYFTYIVKNVGLMGVIAMASVVALPMAFIFPKLIARFSTAKLMTFGFVLMAAGFLLNFFADANIALLAIGSVLKGIGAVPASMLLVLLVLDCAEFNEWKGIHRMEGTMSSMVGLAQKVGAAIGTGVLGFILQFAGYTGDAATMPGSAVTMIRMLYSLIPMVLYILVALAMKAYKLDKQLPQIKADNEVKREAARAKAGKLE